MMENPYIVRNDFSWAESASLVVIIGIGTFAEYFFGITYKTFLMANQSMYIYNIIQIFSKIANTIVSMQKNIWKVWKIKNERQYILKKAIE